MPDYSKTIIYKLCCKDTNIKDIYIGSTSNFKLRKFAHKSDCYNISRRHYNYKVYQFIRENGGWENWTMIMVHEYPECENKLQKESKEREYIELLKPSLNMKIPTRTDKEYYQDNKETLSQKSKEYRDDNKEKIREYYENNKETISQKKKNTMKIIRVL